MPLLQEKKLGGLIFHVYFFNENFFKNTKKLRNIIYKQNPDFAHHAEKKSQVYAEVDVELHPHGIAPIDHLKNVLNLFI